MLLRDDIYHALRRAILTGEYQPGEELREQILAERYRVSRSPIRDALLRLQHENLITVLPRQGYQVRPISLPDVRDMLDLRILIEPACAAGAARADSTATEGLDQFRNRAKQDDEEPVFLQGAGLFHCAVAKLCGNRRLAAFALDLAEQLRRLMQINRQAFTHDQVYAAGAEHDVIIDAIQAHDIEGARRLARQHALDANVRIEAALRRCGAHVQPSSETADYRARR